MRCTQRLSASSWTSYCGAVLKGLQGGACLLSSNSCSTIVRDPFSNWQSIKLVPAWQSLQPQVRSLRQCDGCNRASMLAAGGASRACSLSVESRQSALLECRSPLTVGPSSAHTLSCPCRLTLTHSRCPFSAAKWRQVAPISSSLLRRVSLHVQSVAGCAIHPSHSDWTPGQFHMPEQPWAQQTGSEGQRQAALALHTQQQRSRIQAQQQRHSCLTTCCASSHAPNATVLGHDIFAGTGGKPLPDALGLQ